MNIELKEKEMIRDHYFKKAIIYLNLIGLSPFVVVFLASAGNFIQNGLLKKTGDRGFELGVIVGVVICAIFVSTSVYYSTNFLKFYKECQELANPTLTQEIATESEAERERERRKRK
jgi:uncharacterized membrane protein